MGKEGKDGEWWGRRGRVGKEGKAGEGWGRCERVEKVGEGEIVLLANV